MDDPAMVREILAEGRRVQQARHDLLTKGLTAFGLPAHPEVGLQHEGYESDAEYWAARAGMAEAALMDLFRRDLK